MPTRGTGYCKNGHEMPKPSRKGVRCTLCPTVRKVMPNGVPSGPLPAHLRTPIPPDDVLDFAACTVADAPLFDPMDSRYSVPPAEQERLSSMTRMAISICRNECPAIDACREDAHRWRREGVYGGVYMTSGYHTGRAQAARHAADPIVPAQGDQLTANLREAIAAIGTSA